MRFPSFDLGLRKLLVLSKCLSEILKGVLAVDFLVNGIVCGRQLSSLIRSCMTTHSVPSKSKCALKRYRYQCGRPGRPKKMEESELNAIRAARLAELQKKQSQGASSGVDEQKFTVLAQVLELSARERLSRVRIVRPDRAEQVEQYLMKLIQMGSVTRKLGEQDIVEILESLSRDEKKQSKIVFERRGEGSDDDEDDFFD